MSPTVKPPNIFYKMNTQYTLVHKSQNPVTSLRPMAGNDIKKSNSFEEIWSHIKNFINEPRDWIVCEFNNYEITISISAFYLVENFKTTDTLPKSISEIRDLIELQKQNN